MAATQKPQLGFWQSWNLCFGFIGISAVKAAGTTYSMPG
jgi:hypothetical protein